MENNTANSYSIGHTREDGSFQLLATLNNNDETIPNDKFQALVQAVAKTFSDYTLESILMLRREDAPDYLDLMFEEE